MNQKTELVIFKAKDVNVKLDLNIENEKVWLTPNSMYELFKTDRSLITRNIKNIFKEK